MQNVAAYAGVSIATVSKVMQGDPTVRPENVTAVQNAIEALGYRINPLAADLRRGRRKIVGAIVPSLDGVTGALVTALEREAEAHGYALAVASSQDSEPREGELIGRFLDWRVAGIVIVPVENGSRGPALMLGEGATAVFVDRIAAAEPFDAVSPDYDEAAHDLLKGLAERGHDRVLVVSRQRSTLGAGQLLACLEQLARRRTSRVRLTSLVIGDDVIAGTGQLQASLAGPDRPSGLVALWSPAVLVAIAQAAANMWAIPADLTVVGLQDAEWLRPGTTFIDVVGYPVERVAARAIKTLLQRLEQPQSPVQRSVEPMPARLDWLTIPPHAVAG